MTPPNSSAPTSTPSPAQRGRPRDPRRSRAILDAARGLLREGGWDALTFEAVASRANVGRPTVYRRWPSKGHLAAEILALTMDEARRSSDAEIPDTGSLRGDLLAYARTLVDLLAHLEVEGVQPGVLAQMTLDPEVARQVRTDVMDPHRDRHLDIVRRAAKRGEARSDADPALVLDSITALVIHLRYLTDETLDDGMTEQIVDLVIGGVTA